MFFFQVFINEVGNDEAKQAVQAVLDYIVENPLLGLSVDLKQVYGNRSKPREFLKTCKF